MDERRRHPRHQVWFPVQLDRRGGTSGIAAACQDGSASGLLLRSPAVVDVGERVSLVFRALRAQRNWFRFEGTVVRVDVELDGDGDHEHAWPAQIAVELDEPSEKLGFFCELAGVPHRPSRAARAARAAEAD
jgi:hypothetical protein